MKYLNVLNRIPGVGPQKIKMLLAFLGTPENIWRATRGEILQSGIGEKLTEAILTGRQNINPEAEWEKLEKSGLRAIGWESDNYPRLLKEIPSPPPLIYVKGVIDFNAQPMLAMVGSRKFTAYGQQVAGRLAFELTRAGVLVVSGLALGIDAIAHRGALDAGGKTIAVLGSSLEDDVIGPRSNFQLSREIIKNGALISELPLGTPPTPGMFPARNRLMAGMTLGTIVIEAAEDSGSLITARLALDFNREVLAVPGSIFSPSSTGTHRLIKEGAKMVTGLKDILEELNIEKKTEEVKMRQTLPVSAEEEKILKLLSHEPTHIDKITRMTTLRTNEVGSLLSILEMKGLVKDIGGQNYILI